MLGSERSLFNQQKTKRWRKKKQIKLVAKTRLTLDWIWSQNRLLLPDKFYFENYWWTHTDIQNFLSVSGWSVPSFISTASIFKSILLIDHPHSFTVQIGHLSLLAKNIEFTPEQLSMRCRKGFTWITSKDIFMENGIISKSCPHTQDWTSKYQMNVYVPLILSTRFTLLFLRETSSDCRPSRPEVDFRFRSLVFISKGYSVYIQNPKYWDLRLM